MNSVDFTDLPEPTPHNTNKVLGIIALGVVGVWILASLGYVIFGDKFMTDITAPFQALILAGAIYYGRRLIKTNNAYLPSVQAFAAKNAWSIRYDDPLTDTHLLPPDLRDRRVVTPIKYVISGKLDDTPFFLYPVEIQPRLYEPRFAYKYRTILRLDADLAIPTEISKSISTEHETGHTFIFLRHTAKYKEEFKQLFAAARA